MKAITIKQEEWKDIPGYEGRYQVSNLGRVRSLCNPTHPCKILKQQLNRYGYMYVSLRKPTEKISKNLSIHQLVAKCFIPNPYSYKCVNHINENRTDNSIQNIEWCDEKYNNNYGLHNDKISQALKGRKISESHRRKIIESRKRIAVLQISKSNGSVINEFQSMRYAERITGIFISGISACCRGKVNTAGGYIWRYKNSQL